MTKAELYQKACMLPLLPGVYIIRDKSDTIIYIGKAKRLRIRVSQYFREGVPHDNKVSQMIAHAYAFDVIVCQSEFEALVLEASQIKAHTPKYNILLKDDKGYSYIRVTREDWPRLSFTLQKEEDGAEYIGPYTSSFAARQMAETAMDAFLLPRCSKRFPQEIGKGRPCLNAHIGKCMAVCSGKISCETYNQAVKNAVHLIRYGKKDILKTLNERMQEASDRLEFETAALLRDQINAITKLTAGQKVVVDPDVEMDVVALAGTPDSVCAAVLRFREGRLTDKREFLFHDTSDIDAVREEFLPRYYLDDEQIPKIIAVDALPPDVDALQQALNQKRGSEVQLYVPQRGDKAHLVEMAHTNAVERLARESGRYAREEKLLDKIEQAASPDRKHAARTLFSVILDISKQLQSRILAKMEIDPIFPVPNFSAAQKIGCQGTNGANSETASQQFFPGRAVTFYPTFEHVFQAVERGEVEFGVLPVYNSTSGSVTPTYDLLGKYNCYITAMNQVKIKHCLAVRPGVSLEQIQAVYSHPQALLQCSDFLKYHNLKQIEYSNTATAAAFVASSSEPFAAICSEECAKQNHMDILFSGIANVALNYTRFICISKQMMVAPDASVISIMMTLPNVPGSLSKILNQFYLQGLDLVKLESRPIQDGSFDVAFYVDFKGNLMDRSIAAFLNELCKNCQDFKLLGNAVEVSD